MVVMGYFFVIERNYYAQLYKHVLLIKELDILVKLLINA